MDAPRRARSRAFSTTLSIALLAATFFSVLAPGSLFHLDLTERFNLMMTPLPGAGPVATNPANLKRIGVVAGHSGSDSGAVCVDEFGNVVLTEARVNEAIAGLVAENLTAQGYQVDLLQEFDPRLSGYRAYALVSIHNDVCSYIDEQATGFKVAATANTRDPNRASRLIECLRDRYADSTGLSFRQGNITNDMTGYHAFDEIDPTTTAAIIEAGFLNLDYDLLVNRPQVVADGITRGILCYVNNESLLGP